MSERTPEERREALARGAKAEDWVQEQLQADGWSVLERNWRGSGGELDLIVLRGAELRVVEVRAREDDDAGAEDSIGPHKRRRLRRAARAWLNQNDPGHDEVAFMVAIVDLATAPWSIHWIDDAFDGA